MIITLTHPKHGTHFAYSEVEAKNCEENGWTRYIEKPKEKGGDPIFADPKIPLRDQYEKMFGKKPHHRMLDETIQERIEAGTP